MAVEPLNFEELGTPDQYRTIDTRLKLGKNEFPLITPLMVYKYKLPECNHRWYFLALFPLITYSVAISLVLMFVLVF